jgi:hypothetical protein
MKTHKIHCPYCDKWDNIYYYGYNNEYLLFICRYCEESINEDKNKYWDEDEFWRTYNKQYEWEISANTYIPDYINQKQWDKYIIYKYKIKNKNWYLKKS